MKVLGVLGSPHKDGPSNSIASEVLRGAKEAGHEVKLYRLAEMDFRGCRACGYCKKHWCDCIIEDDLKPYFKDLQECDGLVLSAPNYCAQVSGDMITYMNRHYCLMMIKNGEGIVRIHPGIKLVGVFSQGQPDPEAYLEQYKWFLNDFEVRGMELQDLIVHTSKMDETQLEELKKRAYNVGKAF